MILGCGENSLRLAPPLVVSREEAGVALDILEDALSAAEKEFAQAGRLETVPA
jgi:4-aminobutyrate aminotransferase